MILGVLAKTNSLYLEIHNEFEDEAEVHFFSLLNDPLAAVEQALGITSGRLLIDAVLIDPSQVDSSDLLSIVDQFVAAGIIVFISEAKKCISLAWDLARMGAFPLRIGSLREDLLKVDQVKKYDKSTLEIENLFAENYDRKELASIATVRSILWENAYVLKQLREYIENHSSDIRLLDLGCGTGRFEEVLLSDEVVAASLQSLDAVDFAPMYLKKARERLSYLLPDELYHRIHFHRRIAEDTRFPSDSYDAIVAGFGVICFSKFYYTLPEIHRLLKPGGIAILIGYNRNSLSYEMSETSNPLNTEFIAKIDPKSNKMHLDGKIFNCFTFDLKELQALLRFMGFHLITDSIETSPILNSTLQNAWLADDQDERFDSLHHSYQSKHLEKKLFRQGLSEALQLIDQRLDRALKNRGFYFSITVTK